jgi:inner membrane protein
VPSSFSHAVAAVAFGRAYTTRDLPTRFWVLSIACALAPDLDILSGRFGIGLETMLGHRGLTHSFFFALLLAGAVVLLAFRKPTSGVSRRSLFLYFFAVTASHAVLDALVDGDWGVAFFAPFSSARFLLPWRPIHASPVGRQFFSSTGASVILNELVWVWMPSLVVCLAPWLGKRWLGRQSADAFVDESGDAYETNY